MNPQDFNLLTQEEIDSVVAEVIEEAGLAQAAGRLASRAKKGVRRAAGAVKQAGQDFKKGKDLEDADVSDKVGDMSDEDLNTTSDVYNNMTQNSARLGMEPATEPSEFEREIERRKQTGSKTAQASPAPTPPKPGGPNQQTDAAQGGTGGATGGDGIPEPTSNGAPGVAGLDFATLKDPKTGELYTAQDLQKLAAGDTAFLRAFPGGTGYSPDEIMQAATNKLKAQGKGNIGNPNTKQGDRGAQHAGNQRDAADAAEAGLQGGGDGGAGSKATGISMNGNWYTPGTSSIPKAQKKIVQDTAQKLAMDTELSISDVLDAYTAAMYPGDDQAMQQTNAKSHWLGIFRGLVNDVDIQDTPQLQQAAGDKVRRQLDSLVYRLSARLKSATPEEKEKIKQKVEDVIDDPTPPVDPPEEVTPTDEPGDPIPINKFPPRKKDKDGNPIDGKREQPLRSKLSKAGLNPQVVNTVMRAITKQLKAQNVPFTESMKKQVTSLVIERLLVKEIKNIMLSEKGNPDDFTGQKDTPLTRPKRKERPDQAVNGKYFMAWLKKLRKKSGINFEPTATRSAVDRVLAKAIGPSVGISEAATEDPSVIRYTDLHKALMKVPYAGEQEGTLSADEADKLGKLIMKALQEDPKIVKHANIRFEMPGDAGEDDEPEKEDIPDELTIQNTDTWPAGDPPDKVGLTVGYDEKDPDPEPGPEHHKYGQVPDLFKKYWNKVTKNSKGEPKSRVGDMSAEEAWKNLPSGKEGRKRQNVAESLLSSQELLHFAKLANLLEARVNPRASGADDDTVMPKTGQGRGTSRKDLDRSVDKFGQGRKPAGTGSDDYEITKASFFSLQDDEKHSEMRSFVGALVNKLAQNVKGRDASKGGFGGDTFKQARGEKGGGTIKMSTMNQQLKANGVDRKIRKQVMGLVQKHLQPYLKKNKLKLSETQINQIFDLYIDKLLKERARVQD